MVQLWSISHNTVELQTTFSCITRLYFFVVLHFIHRFLILTTKSNKALIYISKSNILAHKVLIILNGLVLL